MLARIDVHEVLQRRRIAVGIARGKAAADVEAVDHDARLDDDAMHLAQRRDVGVGRRRLRADVERETQLGGNLARLDQKLRGLLAVHAELALQRNAAVDRRHRDAHPQQQVAGAAGRLDDLVELVLAIERERAHAELVGAANGVPRLHRMHEVQVGVGDRRRILDLGQRGDVEMADAGAIQRADQEDGAVRLVGVGDVTGKLLEEPARSAPCSMRSQATYRPLGPGLGNQRRRRGEFLHRIGPPPPGGEHGQLLKSRDRRKRKSAAFRVRTPPCKDLSCDKASGWRVSGR